MAKLNVLFFADCVVLGYIGQSPLEAPFLFLGQLSTAIYFLYFLLCPVINYLDTLFVKSITFPTRNQVLSFSLMITIVYMNIDYDYDFNIMLASILLFITLPHKKTVAMYAISKKFFSSIIYHKVSSILSKRLYITISTFYSFIIIAINTLFICIFKLIRKKHIISIVKITFVVMLITVIYNIICSKFNVPFMLSSILLLSNFNITKSKLVTTKNHSPYFIIKHRISSMLILTPNVLRVTLICHKPVITLVKRFFPNTKIPPTTEIASKQPKDKNQPSLDKFTKELQKDINNNNNNGALPIEKIVKEDSTTDYTASHYQTNTPKSQINSSEEKKNFDQMQQDSKKFSDKENPAENSPSDLNNDSELVNNTPNKEVEDTNYEKFQRYTGAGAPLDNNLPKSSDYQNNDNVNVNNNTATINSPYTKFIPPQLRKNSPNIGAGIAAQENRTNSNIKISHNTTTNVSPIASVNLDTGDNFDIDSADEVKDSPQIATSIPTPPPLPLNTPKLENNKQTSITFSEELTQAFKRYADNFEPRQKAIKELEEKIETNQKKMDQMRSKNDSEYLIKALSLLQKAQKSLKTDTWTQEDAQILKEVQEFLQIYKSDILGQPFLITREMKTTSDLLYKYKNDLDKEILIAVEKFLMTEPIVIPYTLEQLEQERHRCKEGIYILEKWGLELPEAIFMEIVRRSRIIINNDAACQPEDSEKDSKPLGKKRISFKQCEGFSVEKHVYTLLEELGEGFIILDEVPLNKRQLNQVLTNYENLIFKAEIVYVKNPNKLVESTEERHIQLVTSYIDDDGKEVSIAFFYATSNKDPNTFLITKQQFMNPNPQEQQDKEQRGRIYKYPVKVTDALFVDNADDSFFDNDKHKAQLKRIEQKETLRKFTEFFKSKDFHGVNVHQIVLDHLREKLKDNDSYFPREPYLFDAKTLSSLAQEYYMRKIDEINKTHLEKVREYHNSGKKIRLEKEKQDENRAKKDFKNKENKYMRDQMPEDIKKLDIVEETLREKKKKSKRNTTGTSNKNDKNKNE